MHACTIYNTFICYHDNVALKEVSVQVEHLHQSLLSLIVLTSILS